MLSTIITVLAISFIVLQVIDIVGAMILGIVLNKHEETENEEK